MCGACGASCCLWTYVWSLWRSVLLSTYRHFSKQTSIRVFKVFPPQAPQKDSRHSPLSASDTRRVVPVVLVVVLPTTPCATGPILKASVPVVQFSMQQQKDYEMTPRRKIRRRHKLDDLGRRSVSYVPSGYREPVGALPVVSAGCICRDRHQPDKDGLIFTDPCCELHGVSSRRWAPLLEEVA